MTSVAQRIRSRRTRAEIARAAALANRAEGTKRRASNRAEAAIVTKQSAIYRLQGALTRQQYEAGCRLRDDWLDHLDANAGGATAERRGQPTAGNIPHERLLRQVAALRRFEAAADALHKAGVYIHNVTQSVCVLDSHPADMARRIPAALGITEAAIMQTLKRGLDALARFYGRMGR
jgi:hypothetical protein